MTGHAPRGGTPSAATPETAPSLYGELKRREAAQVEYQGRLVLRAHELRWEQSPQGRNAPLVDALTGIDARTFGLVIAELAPGGMSGLHRHSFEAVGYVLSGTGYEIIGDERVPWSAGDTFYMPPNVLHRHVNTSTTEVARILQVEAWPLAQHLRLLHLEQVEEAVVPDPAE